jgi:hypothetical protein
MTKQEKVEMINAAVGRSEVAVRLGALAELREDGTLRYSTLYPNRPQSRRYVQLRDILSLLHGSDIRAIRAAIN